MITSKFSPSVYFFSFLLLSFPFIASYFIIKINNLLKGELTWGVIIFFVIFGIIGLLVTIWGLFVEMNLRMAKLRIDAVSIEIIQMLGFGTKRKLNFSYIDGYIIKSFKSRGQTQEYFYLIKNQKAIGVFSSLYLKNYSEIKDVVASHLKNFG